MKYRLLDFMQCFNCKRDFALQVFQSSQKSYNVNTLIDNNLCPSDCKNPDPQIIKNSETETHCKRCYETEINEGLLTCKCGKVYPIIRDIPRFLPSAFNEYPEFTHKYYSYLKEYGIDSNSAEKKHFDTSFKKTQKTFGRQWKTWGKSERIYGFTDDEAREWFLTDLTAGDINTEYFQGKTVLEVGCGHGRFVKILNDLCSEYIALDLGPSVDLAHEITKDRPAVHIVQANAMTPPFREESFDYVWSHGVLHHTPSTREAFNAISVLSKKHTGRTYIWVYHKGGFIWEYGNRFLRSITSRLPASLIHFISYALVPFLYLIPAYNKSVNLSNMSWRECALSVHDWIAPKYQWHHSAEEVISWFEELGYTDIEQTSANGVGITGVRR